VARKSRALAVPFIENRGQVDERVGFYAQTFGGTVFVTRAGEIVYSLPGARAADETPRQSLTLREVLVGARVAAVRGESEAATRVSSFKGRDRSRWRKALPVYDAVSLGEVYPGIELRLKARGDNVEKLFQVKPGASPGEIRLRVEGARRLSVSEGGELVAATELGPVAFTSPVAYQETEGRVVRVRVRYEVHPDGASYGFEVGDYDAARPLVIDPLLASTFVGGGNTDRAYAIALERIALSGPPNVFIAGWTSSADFPTAPPGHAYDPTYGHADDAFVAKLDGTLTQLLAATFLGGRSTEEAWGAATDVDGNVYVTGWTNSGDFPTLPGAFREVNSGGRTDAFVAKLDNGLENLLASTFLGGTREDRGQAIAVGGWAGEGVSVYVTGYTDSRDFPLVYEGQPDARMGFGPLGRFDVFIARLGSGHLGLADSAKIGGQGDDFAYAIAVGGENLSRGGPFVAITGCAGRPSGGILTEGAFYPTTPGAYDRSQSSSVQDAFVTVLPYDLVLLYGSTFLGGGNELGGGGGGSCGRAVAMPASDIYSPTAIYVAGVTESAAFPTTPGAYDRTYNDRGWGLGRKDCGVVGVGRNGDAFVAKLTGTGSFPDAAELTTLAASTFLGGCARDIAWALALDGSGNVLVAGYTYSSDFPPTPGAYDETPNGRVDGFVSKLDGDLTTLLASTFLGGSRNDFAIGLALDAQGSVYVAGYTRSDDFPTTPGAYDTTHNGSSDDAFVSKLDANLGVILID